jgi:Glycosyltransferase family 92
VKPSATPYLSVSSCLGFDAPYLLEWVEFHRLAGVERFFLYNNGDREGQRRLLEPYVEEGTVVLHEWPVFPAPQVPSFRHTLSTHRDDSRWIAFIDTDEFLFSPTRRPLPELLREYERHPAVGVCRAFFGPSGHRTKPPGLVIESYLSRLSDWKGSAFIKSIIDPSRTVRPQNPHYFIYEEGAAVDENHDPVDNQHARSLSYARLRINHYFTRSEEEWRQKVSRLRPDTGEPYRSDWTPDFMRTLDEQGGERDETILTYVPALKRALAGAEARQPA